MPGTSPTAETPSPRYSRLDKAAEYADCSTATLRRYIAAGRLTGYRLGDRVIRVDLSQIDSLMQVIPTVGTSNDAA